MAFVLLRDILNTKPNHSTQELSLPGISHTPLQMLTPFLFLKTVADARL